MGFRMRHDSWMRNVATCNMARAQVLYSLLDLDLHSSANVDSTATLRTLYPAQSAPEPPCA